MFGVSHSYYLIVFAKSIGAGFVIGLLYMFFMLLRVFGVNGRAAVFFQDVLFFLAAAVVSFLILFDVFAGIRRFYYFFGEICGFFLFYYGPGASAIACVQRFVKNARYKKKGQNEKRNKKMRCGQKNCCKQQNK